MRSTVALGVTVLVIGGVFLYRERADRAREVADLRRELRMEMNASSSTQATSLQHQVLTRLVEHPAAPTPTTGQPAPAAPSNAAPAPSPAESEAADKARVEEISVRLSSEFEGESRDPAWSRDAQATIEKALQSRPADGSKVTNIDCRSSFCRVGIAHEDENARMTFVQGMFAPPNFWAGERVALRTTDAQGRSSTVLYLGKDGRALGSLD